MCIELKRQVGREGFIVSQIAVIHTDAAADTEILDGNILGLNRSDKPVGPDLVAITPDGRAVSKVIGIGRCQQYGITEVTENIVVIVGTIIVIFGIRGTD